MKQLTDYIQVVPNVLPVATCDEIVKILKSSKSWEPAQIRSGGGSVDTNVRNCDTIQISEAEDDSQLKYVDSLLFPAAGVALRAYQDLCAPRSAITIDTGYYALRYRKGGFYKTHVDAFDTRPRVLSCSFALNDNYEGGEWGFFEEELKLRAPKGSAVLFPSNFCFPHQILPVTKGARYSVVTWFQ